MVDISFVKSHQHAHGAIISNQDIGLSKDGENLAVNTLGCPLRIIVTSGTVNDCTKTIELTEKLNAKGLITDCVYGTNTIIDNALNLDIKIVIPPKRNRKTQRER